MDLLRAQILHSIGGGATQELYARLSESAAPIECCTYDDTKLSYCVDINGGPTKEGWSVVQGPGLSKVEVDKQYLAGREGAEI